MVYVVAQLTIHDRARYQRYVAGLMVRRRAAFDAWAGSDAYRAIARDRIAAAEGPVLLVHGVR